MANDVSSVHGTGQRSSVYDEFAKGLGLDESSAEIAKEIAAIMGNKSLQVGSPQSTKGEAGTATTATDTPALDNPDDELAKEADLAKLICYLMAENAKSQAEASKDLLNADRAKLQSEHDSQIKQIEKFLKKLDKAAKFSLAAKIFGYLFTAIAVVYAFAASIVSGGAAAGPLIAAIVAVTALILNETGAMEDIINKIADILKKTGMSDMAANILANIIAIGVVIYATAGAGALGSTTLTIGQASKAAIDATIRAVTSTIAKIADKVLSIMKVLSKMLPLVNLGVSIGNTVANYDASKSQINLSELEKYLAIIQKMLEEDQEALEKILGELQNIYAAIVEILQSKVEALQLIEVKTGQMA